ncbi:hypothetical protein [Geobacter sp. FeAm09]|nr:hypothetical protein [Geobacter sp. FeAm09]
MECTSLENGNDGNGRGESGGMVKAGIRRMFIRAVAAAGGKGVP